MINFERAHPEDVSYLVKVSEQAFLNAKTTLPEGYNDYNWLFQAMTSAYLFKILFNGSLIGGFLVYKIGAHNYQLDRLFILPEYQNIGIGKKAIDFLIKRFPEAKVWFTDVEPTWQKYTYFLSKCGFFESACYGKNSIRYIKLIK
ncbi:MAG: GNAT family N-acetyltransferase [Clostridia bacterium]|nr:GNAT family N-acetyltransferase [Clostridia bacterium]